MIRNNGVARNILKTSSQIRSTKIKNLGTSSLKSPSLPKESSLPETINYIVDKYQEKKPFFIGHLQFVQSQFERWQSNLPFVLPHYAVKSNPDRRLVQTLSSLGANFDCASMKEIQDVLSIAKNPNRIIFAHPFKIPSHLEYAASVGVNRMTADNISELEKIHLYHHAETEAGATLDMLRAVQEINAQLGISTDGHLFLSGYSQGGHASMATHKMIEEQFPNEFSLTASAPMSGAYDMSGVQARAMFGSYDRPAYFPFLLWGMNEAYGILPDIRAAIKEEYADTLMAMLENQHYSLRQISRVMPSVPAEIIRPEFLQAYSSDSTFPMRLAMEENSLIDWAPQKPMMICYCKADEQVDYRNALVAYDSMKELGSKSVMLRRAGKNFGHEACALYASVYTKMYFDSFLKGSKNGKKGPVSKRFLISLGKIGGE